MATASFLVCLLSACLLWSATFTAAAARARGWWPCLVLLAILVPAFLLLPPTVVAARLALAPRAPVPVVLPVTGSLLLAALVGSAWIARAGLHGMGRGAAAALDWPVTRLAGACGVAALAACGIFLALDRSVATAGVGWRHDAAALVAANLPAASPGAASAAALHRHAAALLRADRSVSAPDSVLRGGDGGGDATRDLLARHGVTLDLVRRAAVHDVCRFDRDWTRPDFTLRLPEIQDLRDEGRLLALAARAAAVEGRAADALADTIRLHRLASHADGTVLVTHLVALSLRGMARETLGAVLPRLSPADLPLLDDPALVDLGAPPPGLIAPLLGEEALLLATCADVATKRTTLTGLRTELGMGAAGDADGWDVVPDAAYRVFFLPAEAAGIGDLMRRFQVVAASPDFSTKGLTAWGAAAATVGTDARLRGPLATRLLPGLGSIENAQVRAEALASAVPVAIAATRMRLVTGSLPDSCAALVPRFLGAVPADPWAVDAPLRIGAREGGIVIYSVGPDGVDNGGPEVRGEFGIDPGHDDVGLWLAPAT